MKELDQAIAKCRDDIGVLAARLVQLEEARELVAGVLGERPVKPPPRVPKPQRQERAVRAEPTQKGPAKKCPHGEKSRWKCKECRRAYQNDWYAAKTGKPAGKSPKTKAEPDPVPVSAAQSRPAETSRPLVNAVAIANAAKWQKQCPLLNFETGARCSLMLGHEGLHSSSGRLFKTGLNPAELGGTSARAIDAEAVRGRG